MVCLPDELWTDPGMLELAVKRRRLWMLAVAIARLRARWDAAAVDKWTSGRWVLMLRRDTNVFTHVRQFELDLAEMRTQYDVLEENRVALKFTRQNAGFGDEDLALPGLSEDVGLPRRRYPSDDPAVRAERRRSQQPTPQPSATAPQTRSTAGEALRPIGAMVESVAEQLASSASLAIAPQKDSQTASSAQLASSGATPQHSTESGLAEQANTPPDASASGGFRPKHRQPYEDEIAALLARGYRRDHIQRAVAEVCARPGFGGVGRWDLFLPRVIEDLFPAQSAMNLPVVLDNKQPVPDNRQHRDDVKAFEDYMAGRTGPPGGKPDFAALREIAKPKSEQERSA